MNRLDPTLLNIFAAEQSEHLAKMRLALDALSFSETAEIAFEELLRRSHTLKGAARAVGLDTTERIIHTLEGVVAHLRTEYDLPGPEPRAILGRALDFIEDALAAALGQRAEPDLQAMLGGLGSLSGTAGETMNSSPTGSAPSAEQSTGLAEMAADDLVRVDARILDDMLGDSSRLLAIANASSSEAQTVEQYAADLDQTLRDYRRLRQKAAPYLQVHKSDPDFEALAETVSYLDRHLASLSVGAHRIALNQQRQSWDLSQSVEQLHDNLGRARMVPAESSFASFGPMVRGLAEQEGKKVVFRAERLDVNVDRLVLQGLKDAVMHLLRNAVSHGIELPEERVRAGKAPEGAVRLAISSRGDRLSVIVEDDGSGLDLKALSDQAVSRGVVSEDQATEMSSADISGLIFQSGLSTARTVSNISGRGMGLAVVRDAIRRLFGTINVRPSVAGGTQFQISVPLSISIQHVVIVMVDAHSVAVSSAYVEAVGRWTDAQIVTVNGRECIQWRGEAIPLVSIRHLLKLPNHVPADSIDEATIVQAFIFEDAGIRVAISVDRIVDSRDATVRDSGLNGSHAGWTTGGIALENGSVAPFLNLAIPIRDFLRSPNSGTRFKPPIKRKCRVLVVDDSITTRSLERGILEAHGYDVELAVDGAEAWTKILDHLPDLVISDVSMPRMNGIELLKNIKNTKATRDLPVILVSSLQSPEEQEQGLSLGADAYIVKQRFDQKELIATVRQIL